MTSCDDFELAIEMRNHGALPRDREDALLAHLLGCNGCRSFESLSTSSENAMSAHALTHIQSTNWDSLFANTTRVIQRNARDQILRGALALLVATVGLMLMSHRPLAIALIETVAGTLVFGFVWLLSKRRLTKIAGMKQQGELLFQHRFELESRVRGALRVLLLPLTLPFIYLELRPLLVSAQSWIGFGLVAAAILAQTSFVLFIRRPALQRELRELTSNQTA